MKKKIYQRLKLSALGDFLASRRRELAVEMAKEESDKEDERIGIEPGGPSDEQVAAAEEALLDTFAKAADVETDEYLKLESGETEPTDDQVEALAKALGEAGLEVTTDELSALVADEDEDEDEDDGEGEGEGEGDEEAEEESGEESAEEAAAVAELRRKAVKLQKQLDDQAEYVEAGRESLRLRREAVVKSLRLRAFEQGKDAAAADIKRVEKASFSDLKLLEIGFGVDLSQPTCVECGGDAAAYRSSQESVEGDQPSTSRSRVQARGRTPTQDDIFVASLAYREEHEGCAPDEAVRLVGKLEASKVFELVEKYEKSQESSAA